MAGGLGGDSHAGTVGIYAALAYDIIAAVNSSPQTTEINAAARAPTLMKWVHLGLVQVIIFAFLGAALESADGKPAWPPLLGAGLAGGMLYAQYVHAKSNGLKNGGPATESYGSGGGWRG